MVFYLIMNLLGEMKLCYKKIIKGLIDIKFGRKKFYFLEIYIQKETGVMLKIMSELCG